jgi:hypothetical protein
MAWYKTGTVAVTSGQTLVTGSGTLWSINVKPGDAFTLDGTKMYEVASLDVTNPDTKLYLRVAYTGSTLSGQAYSVMNLSTVSISTATLAAQVSALLNGWQTRETEFTTWQGGSATAGFDVNGNPTSGSTAGYYPLTDALGAVHYCACPAKMLPGPGSSQAFTVGALTATTVNGAAISGTATTATLGNGSTTTTTLKGVVSAGTLSLGNSAGTSANVYNTSVAGRLLLSGSIDGTVASLGGTIVLREATSAGNPKGIELWANNTQALTVTQLSNTLAGYTTDDGVHRLQVYGSLIASTTGTFGTGVAISATPSAWLASMPSMEIGSTTSISSDGVNLKTMLINNAYKNTSGSWIYKTSNGVCGMALDYMGNVQFLLAPIGTAGNTATLTVPMTLNTSGNLLIASGTDNGTGAKLQITGSVTATGTNNASNFNVSTTSNGLNYGFTSVGKFLSIGYGLTGGSDANPGYVNIYNGQATVVATFSNTGLALPGHVGRTLGTAVASATTITPTGAVFHVSGTTPVATINLPYAGFVGEITIIPDGLFTTTTAGNIGLASVMVVGKANLMTYDGTKWYPSY